MPNFDSILSDLIRFSKSIRFETIYVRFEKIRFDWEPYNAPFSKKLVSKDDITLKSFHFFG